MKNALDSAKIEIPCPHCDKKNSETIGSLKTKKQLTCRHCRETFDLDTTHLRAEIAKVEKKIQKTLAAFGRLGK